MDVYSNGLTVLDDFSGSLTVRVEPWRPESFGRYGTYRSTSSRLEYPKGDLHTVVFENLEGRVNVGAGDVESITVWLDVYGFSSDGARVRRFLLCERRDRELDEGGSVPVADGAARGRHAPGSD